MSKRIDNKYDCPTGKAEVLFGLRQHQKLIKKAGELSTRNCPFNETLRDRWLKYGQDDPDCVDVVMRGAKDGKVHILEIIETARKAKKDPSALRKAFLMAMIWGFYDQGYGPYRTYMTMMGSRGFEKKLQTAWDLVRAGRTGQAYVALSGIRMLGRS